MKELRRDQPVPLYYQIEVAIRRAIEAGAIPDGRLQTEAELAQRYGVSRQTVRSALRRLEEDGLIVRRRAHGTFVRAGAPAKLERQLDHLLGFEADLRRQGASPSVEVLTIERIEPPAAVAEALRLGEAPAHRLRRLGRVDGRPLWLEARYYPPDIGERMLGQDLSSGSITNLLQSVLGVRVVAGRVRIEAAAANATQARHLSVRAGHPLLVSQFAFYDANGRALEVVRAAFRGDRYAFAFDTSAHALDAPDAAWAGDDGGMENRPVLTGHLRSDSARAPAMQEE